MSQKKIKKIFLNYDQGVQFSKQKVCKICGRDAKQYSCYICLICDGCEQKVYQECQKNCLDKIQLQKILQIILGIKLRNVISIFSQIYALQQYYSDTNEVFYVQQNNKQIFFTTLILGTFINLILFFILMKMFMKIKKIKSIQDQIDNKKKNQKVQIRQKQPQSDSLAKNFQEIKGKLSRNSSFIIEPHRSNSDVNLKRFHILNFIENKIEQQQAQDKISKVFDTDPSPVMFDKNQNDENQIELKMQRLSIFTLQPKKNLNQQK